MSEEEINRGKRLIRDLAELTRQLSDEEVTEVYGTGLMHELLLAILNPADVRKHRTIAEFLLENKNRATLLAILRHGITINYSFSVSEENRVSYVSPYFVQWFDNGVLFLEGGERFSGFLGLYRDGEVKYGIAARDLRPGDKMGPEEFEFVTIEEFNERLHAIPPGQLTDLEKPARELKSLLERGERSEAKYHNLIRKYPWILGAQYEKVDDHRHLDDENVPDFTGVRVHDKYRDIIEIKQPFIKVFRQDGEFTAEFNGAWNQVERYLRFAREQRDYLSRKGLNFDNPQCYLLLGSGLSEEKVEALRAKERMVPGIRVLTYDQFIAFVEWTIRFLKSLSGLQPTDRDNPFNDPNHV